jgi:hypothetical protein
VSLCRRTPVHSYSHMRVLDESALQQRAVGSQQVLVLGKFTAIPVHAPSEPGSMGLAAQ